MDLNIDVSRQNHPSREITHQRESPVRNDTRAEEILLSPIAPQPSFSSTVPSPSAAETAIRESADTISTHQSNVTPESSTTLPLSPSSTLSSAPVPVSSINTDSAAATTTANVNNVNNVNNTLTTSSPSSEEELMSPTKTTPETTTTTTNATVEITNTAVTEKEAQQTRQRRPGGNGNNGNGVRGIWPPQKVPPNHEMTEASATEPGPPMPTESNRHRHHLAVEKSTSDGNSGSMRDKLDALMNTVDDNVMKLYEEVDVCCDDDNDNDNETTEETIDPSQRNKLRKRKRRVRECSLKHNPQFRCYWRLIALLHDIGHSIAKLPCCGKPNKSNGEQEDMEKTQSSSMTSRRKRGTAMIDRQYSRSSISTASAAAKSTILVY